MTTVFEVHFTRVEDFLEELQADHQRTDILDNLLRIAWRRKAATAGQARGRRYHNEADDLPAFEWAAAFVEASYISSRQQLVKLSAYCGCTYLGQLDAPGKPSRVNEFHTTATAATNQLLLETTRKLQAEGERRNLDVRGGGLYVEEGAWVASPDDPIDTPPDAVCATCSEPIYYANEQWRHRDTLELSEEGNLHITKGRAEATMDHLCSVCGGVGTRTVGNKQRRCDRCMGQGKLAGGQLHHLADPDQEGRTV